MVFRAGFDCTHMQVVADHYETNELTPLMLISDCKYHTVKDMTIISFHRHYWYVQLMLADSALYIPG